MENTDKRMINQEKAKEYKEKMKNKKYVHFKGNIYVVDFVATHTETNEELVIYHRLASDKEYARPKEMFLSEVDKEKYPDCELKWRFELTE